MQLLAFVALATSSAHVHGLGVHASSKVALSALRPARTAAVSMSAAPKAEGDLLTILADDASCGIDERRVGELCAELAQDGGAMREPLDVIAAAIEGEWRLLHTSSSKWDPQNPLGRRADNTAPGLEGLIGGITGGTGAVVASASPIQRAITKAFSVSQEGSFSCPIAAAHTHGHESACVERKLSVGLSNRFWDGQVVALAGADPRVTQWVELPGGARIELSAKGSIEAAQPERLLFSFDRGEIRWPNGVAIPYPAPFKLLGNEAKGWLDTLYLSPSVRISKGNKGTTFVFVNKGE